MLQEEEYKKLKTRLSNEAGNNLVLCKGNVPKVINPLLLCFLSAFVVIKLYIVNLQCYFCRHGWWEMD